MIIKLLLVLLVANTVVMLTIGESLKAPRVNLGSVIHNLTVVPEIGDSILLNNLSVNMTWQELSAEIASMIGYPTDIVRPALDGKVLADDMTLGDAGLSSGDQINAFIDFAITFRLSWNQTRSIVANRSNTIGDLLALITSKYSDVSTTNGPLNLTYLESWYDYALADPKTKLTRIISGSNDPIYGAHPRLQLLCPLMLTLSIEGKPDEKMLINSVMVAYRPLSSYLRDYLTDENKLCFDEYCKNGFLNTGYSLYSYGIHQDIQIYVVKQNAEQAIDLDGDIGRLTISDSLGPNATLGAIVPGIMLETLLVNPVKYTINNGQQTVMSNQTEAETILISSLTSKLVKYEFSCTISVENEFGFNQSILPYDCNQSFQALAEQIEKQTGVESNSFDFIDPFGATVEIRRKFLGWHDIYLKRWDYIPLKAVIHKK